MLRLVFRQRAVRSYHRMMSNRLFDSHGPVAVSSQYRSCSLAQATTLCTDPLHDDVTCGETNLASMSGSWGKGASKKQRAPWPFWMRARWNAGLAERIFAHDPFFTPGHRRPNRLLRFFIPCASNSRDET